VEAVASAAVLAVVVLGVYAGLDGTIALSGQNKSRTVAAALAQQDQEQLRAQRATQLSNFAGTRKVTVSGVEYTVESRTTWISDASGTESCSSQSKRADYLKISSEVTSPAMSGKPVRMVSVVAPPAGGLGGARGNIAVQLVNETGMPVEGVAVAVTPGAASQTTNSVGCAFFGHLTAGTYDARFSRGGWVNPAGATDVMLTGSAVTGTTSTLSESYAQAARVSVNFGTINESGNTVTAQHRVATFGNPGLPQPGTRSFPVQNPQETIDATGLFPFTSGYGVYAGSCASASPANYSQDYWSNYPGYATTGPGSATAVTVIVPTIRAAVRRGGVVVSGARVVVRATGAGCTDSATLTTDSRGFVDVPMPFGPYSVCADNGTRRLTVNVNNTVATGTSRIDLNIPSSGSSSTCL